jgi:hypothetical protein
VEDEVYEALLELIPGLEAQLKNTNRVEIQEIADLVSYSWFLFSYRF